MVLRSLPLSRSFLNPFLDLVFPRICFACSERIDDQDRFLCQKCRKELLPVGDFACPVCGSFETVNQQDCSLCNSEEIHFDRGFSLIPYNDVVRTLIHELKYNEMTKVADYLVDYSIRHIEARMPFSDVDYVCPVPLHSTKKRERGYNQAALIAKKIAAHFKWQYEPGLVKRFRFTESQADLSPEQRRKNVNRAFSVNKKFTIRDKNILIVDDVFTTGATVNSISQVLREQKVNKIYALTVARA